jgi:uracil-DNA glycosylase
MATARLDSLYPNLFVPGHLLSQSDARWKLESILASDRAVFGLYHPATLTRRKHLKSFRAAFRELREKLT